jgi:predicted metal-dependent peptidase
MGADAQPTDQQQDSDRDGRGESTPPPLSSEERQTLEVQWQQRLAGAAQQAMQAGKMGGTIARLIDHLLQPQLPWRMLLARYMTAMARDDFSYMRPSRREGDAILPSLKSSQLEVVVALDTSGSIRAKEMDEFLAEVSALKGQMRARVTLLACDSSLSEGAPWMFEPWEEFECPAEIQGGGGTDFRPVFEWLEDQGQQPDLLVYFTDAQGRFPKREPNFPVIWLVKGKDPVPWGQRIQLN